MDAQKGRPRGEQPRGPGGIGNQAPSDASQHVSDLQADGNRLSPEMNWTTGIIAAIMNTGLSASAKTIAIKLLMRGMPHDDGIRGVMDTYEFRIAEVMLWASLKDRRAAVLVVKALEDAGIISILSRPMGGRTHYIYFISPDCVKSWAKKNRLRPPKDTSNKARKELLARAEGACTPDDIWRIYRQQQGRCAACKEEKRLTVDHIVAITKGGTNHPKNIQLLCRPCNSRKGNKNPVDFMRSTGVLL